jgi:uncharacterized protein (DUF1684 family)
MHKVLIFPMILVFSFTMFGQQVDQDLLKWREKRLASLTSEEGWVTLAGLYWLTEGDNSFGRSPENKLIANYPAFPERAGTFRRRGETVEFIAQTGVTITRDGEPVTATILRDDREGKPTLLRFLTFSWHLIVRGDRLGVRMKWSQHPNRGKLTALPAYPSSPDWRIKARFKPYDIPKKMMIPSVIGTQSEEDCPGEIHLTIRGTDLVLYPTGTREAMSLIFGDATNGHETYAGGRFLPLPGPDEQNEMIIDFNYAYNPPCVFTPFATCPVPVSENILSVGIEAGEKMVELFPH